MGDGRRLRLRQMNSLVSTLKQSYNSWGLLAPVFPLSVAGVLGVAGLVLGLTRDAKFRFLSGGFSSWLTRNKDDEPLEYHNHLVPPGLQNLGNNCFLNVVLQALASCSSFNPSLRSVLRECESSGERGETLQLTLSLSSLLEELCSFCDGGVVLNPRRVMLVMAQYNPNLNLTRQQDAEEAFLHLLSSLREEFLDCYFPFQGSLLDTVASPGCRILAKKKREIQNELERWQQHLLGPFDGILSSTLTCQTCSSQISMNFQFFHSLPLSPVLGGFGSSMADCSLEDCLKQFISAERVENYNCNRCWHIAAIKYLTVRASDKTEIEKLKICSEEDSCACRHLGDLENLPWSSNYSSSQKQLRIARCPKILCIHMQRVFINPFGELIKSQGHIRFPLVLNMRPFMLEDLLCENQPNLFREVHSIKKYYHWDRRDIHVMASAKNVIERVGNAETVPSGFIFPPREILSDTNGCLEAEVEDTSVLEVNCAERRMYQLVSVVEHYGRAGGGHYTVYRSAEHGDENSLSPSRRHWFCISDSDVQNVTQEEVLSAEASLLFYERIGEM